MPNKVLLTQALTDLATTDLETVGSLFERDGKVYRYVKNKGTTALIADATCLIAFTSVEANILTRVIAPDGAAAATALVSLPAGVPMAAIGASGSSTGDHGWIQVKGVHSTRVMLLTTGYVGGEIFIATNVPATGAWGVGYAESADSATASYHYSRKVQLLVPIATTGAATAVTAIVDVMCLP